MSKTELTNNSLKIYVIHDFANCIRKLSRKMNALKD